MKRIAELAQIVRRIHYIFPLENCCRASTHKFTEGTFSDQSVRSRNITSLPFLLRK